jgi:mono/diheme cytochrome c family protein
LPVAIKRKNCYVESRREVICVENLLVGKRLAQRAADEEPDVMRNSRRFQLCCGTAGAVLALLAASAPGAAVPADPARGAKLAKQWCASCHIVSSDQARGADVAPPFASIAKRPGFTAERTAYFLMRSHPRMPDVHLTRDEARDLGAYIATLAH